MLYYVTFQIDRSIKLEISDDENFVNSFSEKIMTPTGMTKRYFHNTDDGGIYGYCVDGKIEIVSEFKYSEEEAEDLFLELAIENANNTFGKFMFYPTKDPKVLIADIEDYLTDNDNDNKDLNKSLEKILEQLKSL